MNTFAVRIQSAKNVNARPTKLIAVMLTISTALLVIATVLYPCLPVRTREAYLTWNPTERSANFIAPAVTQTASINARFQCSVFTGPVPQSRIKNSIHHQFLVWGTLPQESPLFQTDALFLTETTREIFVVSKDTVILALPRQLFRAPYCPELHIQSRTMHTRAWVSGTDYDSDRSARQKNASASASPRDIAIAPIFMGFYTDFTAEKARGLHSHFSVDAHIDNRFNVSPGWAKVCDGFFILCLSCISIWGFSRYLQILYPRSRRKNLMKHDHSPSPSDSPTSEFERIDENAPALEPSRKNRFHAPASLHYLFSQWHLSDGIVTAVLALWCFTGSGSAADGYVLGEIDNARSSGYMANYYRFFFVPHSPFSWYLQLEKVLFQCLHTVFLLHCFVAGVGLILWLFLRRRVFPFFQTIRQSLCIYAGMGMFLTMWLPLNSGLQPETAITAGTIAVFYCTERFLNNRHVFFGAAAIFIACVTAAVDPSGIISFAPIIVTARPLFLTLHTLTRQYIVVLKQTYGPAKNQRHARLRIGLAISTTVSPLVMSMCLGCMFFMPRQPISNIYESIKIRHIIGPIVRWSDEYLRYYATIFNADATLSVRVGVFIFLFLLVICSLYLLYGRAFTNVDPSLRRFVLTLWIMLLLNTFTPTKWVLQWGNFTVFACILTAAFVGVICNTLTISWTTVFGYLAVLSLTFGLICSAHNNWPWLENLSILWYSIAPEVVHVRLTSVGFYLGLFFFGVTFLLHYQRFGQKHKNDTVATEETRLAVLAQTSRHTLWRRRCLSIPLVITLIFFPLFNVLVFAKAAYANRQGYSVTYDNLRSFMGKPCALADSISVENNPNLDFLPPYDTVEKNNNFNPPNNNNVGFSPNGLPESLESNSYIAGANQMFVANTPQNNHVGHSEYPGTGGGSRKTAGINGAYAQLPYQLDPKTTPVLGSFGFPAAAHLTTGWYQLPADFRRYPLLVVSVAGSIGSIGKYGHYIYGQSMQIEFADKNTAHDSPLNAPHILGNANFIDPAPGRNWRDLRLSTASIPSGTNLVRLQALDTNVMSDQWMALTPPRLPHLQSLRTVIKNSPTYLDFETRRYFSCFHQVSNHNGLLELPQWRITADRDQMNKTTLSWSQPTDGGPLAIIQSLTEPQTVPTYILSDLYYDWGSVENLSPIVAGAIAVPQLEDKQRWGIDRPEPIRALGGNDEQ